MDQPQSVDLESGLGRVHERWSMASKTCCLAVMVVSLLAAGCWKPTEPASTGYPHLTTAVLSQPTVAPGGTLNLILSVTNHEPEEVMIGFPSTCQLLYAVHNGIGAQVSEGFACGAMQTTLRLGPGETREVATTWKASRYVYEKGAEVPLPPGKYRVYAYLSEHGYTSEPAEVQVRE